MIDLLTPHLLPAFGLFMGWWAHIWTASREMSAAKGQRVWPWQFLARRPMRCVLSFHGAIGGYFLLIELDMVSPFAAFGVGLISDMLLDSVRSVTKQRLGLDATQEAPAVNLNETTVLRSEEKQ